jgi:hypothetical protein
MGYIINRSIVWTRPEKHGICSHKRRLPSSCNRNPIPDDGITTAHVPCFDQGTTMGLVGFVTIYGHEKWENDEASGFFSE